MKPTRPNLPVNGYVRFAMIALALLLTACVGGTPQSEPRSEPVSKRVVGVVDHVDSVNRVVKITTDRDSSVARAQRLNLYYDDLTTVNFEGESYRPEDLEPGDRVVADVVGDIAFLEVRSILVTEDGSPGGVFGTDDRHISGTLRRIDNRDRTLIVETNDRAREAVVSFDGRTRVLYDDRNIAISELREFDELEIELVPNSGLAETITVVDSEYASDAGDDFATARGEVVFVDEDRRELVITRDDRFRSSLDSGSSFDSRNSFDTRDDQRATFRYERDVIVEFQGDFYGPSSLERGDGVEIDYERIGEDLWAERIVVTHNGRQ